MGTDFVSNTVGTAVGNVLSRFSSTPPSPTRRILRATRRQDVFRPDVPRPGFTPGGKKSLKKHTKSHTRKHHKKHLHHTKKR
jgi:hypothetical protein